MRVLRRVEGRILGAILQWMSGNRVEYLRIKGSDLESRSKEWIDRAIGCRDQVRKLLKAIKSQICLIPQGVFSKHFYF